METASKYWKLVRIDTTGKRKVEVIDSLQGFYKQQFSELTNSVDESDISIQRRLLQLRQDAKLVFLAEGCLRCFISHQIEQVCIQLEIQFGKVHGFTSYDLFPFVLNDVNISNSLPINRHQPNTYKSVATEILQTFDPERGSLAAWTNQLVKHHQELNRFLLECGVYLVSDWAILNDTTLKQLQRIFSEFHHLTSIEIQQAGKLLESYHAVYRQDRFKLRQAGGNKRCFPPTENQLEQITNLFQSQVNLFLSAKDITIRLQEIAEKLRKYRIYVRGKLLQTESLDKPETHALVMNIETSESNVLNTADEASKFLKFYRNLFLNSLDLSVEKVISDRISSLQSKKTPKLYQFLNALHLFHCQGKSMSEIASTIGLQAQYQVTRLLKLKEFRTDIRQQMLKILLRSILDKAAAYVDPERLQNLDQQVEIALNEQIAVVIEEAADEASTAKTKNFKSLFAQRLCRQLKNLL